MTTTLFRPVGLHELAPIWDKGMREFPPPLPHQPIFYPAINIEYACQIARDWNVVDEKSGFAGFMTVFELDKSHLSKFNPHTVGCSKHVDSSGGTQFIQRCHPRPHPFGKWLFRA